MQSLLIGVWLCDVIKTIDLQLVIVVEDEVSNRKETYHFVPIRKYHLKF